MFVVGLWFREVFVVLGIKDVVEIWPEVLNSSLDERMAPALFEVYLGTAHEIYRDAEKFFARTYLSDSMRRILRDIVGTLLGTSGRNIVPLMSLFGGGKTHTLIAIYHAFSNPGSLGILDRELASRISNVSGVRIVVLDCDSESLVPHPLSPFVEGGLSIRTIWGMLAYRLGKYDLVREDDEKLHPPSPEKLKRLFEGVRAVILIDEVVKYAYGLARSGDNALRNYGEVIPTFVENLAKAIEGTKSVLVITLPIDIAQSGDRTYEVPEKGYGDFALRVYRAVKRVAAKYDVPLTREDIVQVLRKRLFRFIDNDKVAQVCSEVKIRYKQDEVLGRIDSSLYAYLERYYPFHPTYINTLYDIVTRVPELQKTRDALKITRKVIRALWRGRSNPTFIMPWHIDLKVENLLADIVPNSVKQYAPIVEKDLFDRIPKNASDAELAYMVGLAVFLRTYIYPPTVKANKAFPTTNDVLFMVFDPSTFATHNWSPGQIVEVLEELYNSVSLYLQREDDRYWFTPYPSIIELIESEAKNKDYFEALSELKNYVREIYDRSIFEVMKKRKTKKSVGVSSHPIIFRVKNISKDRVILETFDYVDLDMRAYILLVCLEDLSDDDLYQLIYYVRDGKQRTYKNTIAVMYPSDKASIGKLIEFVKRVLAAKEFESKDKLKEIYGDDDIVKINLRKIRDYIKSIEENIYMNIMTTLSTVAFPTYDRSEKKETIGKANVGGQSVSLVAAAEQSLRSGSVFKISEQVSFEFLDDVLKNWLGMKSFSDESFAKMFGEIMDLFYTNPRLPFVSEDSVKKAIISGLESLNIGIIRSGKLYWKKVFKSRQEIEDQDFESLSDIGDNDLIVHWKQAARRLIKDLLEQEGKKLPEDGSIEVTTCYIATVDGSIMSIRDLISYGNYESIVKSGHLFCEKRVIRRGIYIEVNPRSVEVNPGESIEVRVSVKPVGDYQNTIMLKVDTGELVVNEGTVPLETTWVLRAPEKPGHYVFRIIAEGQDIEPAEAQLDIRVMGRKDKICVEKLGPEHIGYRIVSIESSSFNDIRKIYQLFGDNIVVKHGDVSLVLNESKIRLNYESLSIDIAVELIRDATTYLGSIYGPVKSIQFSMKPKKEIIVDENIVRELSEVEKSRFCLRLEGE